MLASPSCVLAGPSHPAKPPASESGSDQVDQACLLFWVKGAGAEVCVEIVKGQESILFRIEGLGLGIGVSHEP